jgi:D-alanyl-D-alanine carboxypeptidase/D-alanyl-D-alanine-endopeptidase (penicillin-binding protein 4)
MAAMVPAIGLGALTMFARSQAVDGPSLSADTTLPASLPAPLTTGLLSVRRAPTVLVGDRRADVLREGLQPLADGLDATSCLAVNVDDVPLIAQHTDVQLIPASNVKIVTAAVALDVLGAGATFTTTVVGPAPVNGVVDGDVYLVGGGDPVLSEQWYTQQADGRKRPPFHVTDVNALADALQAAGVTSITGSVIGDGSRYDDERFPPGWTDDIRASADGTPVGALVINDSTTPTTAHAAEPTASAAKTFVALLDDRGITVAGGADTGTAPTGLSVLGSVTSAPLVDILNEMLATSDNLTAEMLVKEIGYVAGVGGTRAGGLQIITERLATWGMPMAGVGFTDGSGLSRDNQLTCALLAGVLARGSATDPVGAGLARGGQSGSTLADSFRQAGLADVLQGKTGTLSSVKSLSGYFVSGGTEVAFVLILNGEAAGDYQTRWDALGAALLTITGVPAADTLVPQGAAALG